MYKNFRGSFLEPEIPEHPFVYEVVVGTLTDLEKKLFTLSGRLMKELQEHMEAILGFPVTVDDIHIEKHSAEFEQKATRKELSKMWCLRNDTYCLKGVLAHRFDRRFSTVSCSKVYLQVYPGWKFSEENLLSMQADHNRKNFKFHFKIKKPGGFFRLFFFP